MIRLIAAVGLAIATAAAPVQSQEVGISPNQGDVSLILNGQSVTVARIQDTDHMLTGEYARTSRPCPGQCLTPITAGAGIATLGELEVLAFLETDVQAGTGLLIDARLPTGFAQGRIPGAVNVPHTTLEESNPFRSQILMALGAREAGSGFDFADAKRLVLYCDGPWCADARQGLRDLASAGYPTNKLFFYRGGMQAWLHAGLTVQQ